MAESRRRFFLQVDFDDPLALEEVYEHVARVCEFWSQRRGFRDISNSGRAFGFLQVQVVIKARDQWEVHRQAMRFARALAAGARVRVSQFKEPVIEKLAPHTNRGAAAVRGST